LVIGENESLSRGCICRARPLRHQARYIMTTIEARVSTED
jgi:hypothetical protein